MPNGRKPVDLGFAEFAAQVVAELHEGLLVAQNEQESRRAKLAELSSLPLEEFARRFITNEQVEAELIRLFPAGRRKAHRIRVGASYVTKTAKHALTNHRLQKIVLIVCNPTRDCFRDILFF